MAIQFAPTIAQSALDAVRAKLEVTGYAEVTLQTGVFTNSATAVATIDGKDLGTSFPVPPDSMVVCTVIGAVYGDDADGDSDLGYGVNFTVSGFRIGSGNVTDVEGVNTALEINELAIQMITVDAATTNALTVTATADTTNQGIDIVFQNDSNDENCYFVGRATIVCAKKGGFNASYTG